jgi:hypothetical protein
MNIMELYWVAGILDGEGSFYSTKSHPWYPRIALGMTDLDTIEKAKKILKVIGVTTHQTFLDSSKTIYKFTVTGDLAAQWMMTLYTLMSKRRQEKIKDLLKMWKVHKFKTREYCSKGHALIPANRKGHQCKICSLNYNKEKYKIMKERRGETFTSKHMPSTIKLEKLVETYVSPYGTN